MKKLLILVLAAILSSQIFANAENTENKEFTSGENNNNYTFYKNYSHWSIAVSGGFNFLMNERIQTNDDKIANYKNNFLGSGNFEVEYSVNPIWGIALNYAYSPIAKSAIFIDSKTYDVHPEKNGQGHQAYAMLNVNLLNVFRRYRSHSDWGWYAGVGIGAYMHNVSRKMFETEGTGEDVWSAVPMIPVETRVEYSPINSLSVFAKGGLDMYLSDNVNIAHRGSLNDWNLYGGIGLRWNIGASSKQSVRTIDMNTFEGGSKRMNIANDDDNVQNNVQNNDELQAMRNQLADLQRQIAALQAQGEGTGIQTGSVTDANRLAAVERKTDANTEEINEIWSEIEIIRKAAMQSNYTDENSVYFENNSCRVTSAYEIVIAKVAKILLTDKTLHLDINSYCSKNGDVEINKKLGEQRLDAVRYILINRYKISENRIHANYNGQVNDDFDSMNRRCDLIFKER